MKRAMFLLATLALLSGCLPVVIRNNCLDAYYAVLDVTNDRDAAAEAYWTCQEGTR